MTQSLAQHPASAPAALPAATKKTALGGAEGQGWPPRTQRTPRQPGPAPRDATGTLGAAGADLGPRNPSRHVMEGTGGEENVHSVDE